MREILSLPPMPFRNPFSHKGDYGRILVLAGSRGMTGAACLASNACLRSGAGLVTLGVPCSLLPIVGAQLACVMSYPFPETQEQSFSSSGVKEILDIAEKMDVVVLGPGLSQNADTKKMVQEILRHLQLPVVLDADGLNALAQNIEILTQRKFPTILTPHPKEFSRLTKLSMSAIAENKMDIAGEFASKYQCTLVLKFAPTLVTDGERFFTNTTGNPGMATAGSGDVLTGVIAALLGQKFSPFEASQLGVWAHGYAGDLCAKEIGEIGMIASDILLKLPLAFQYHQKQSCIR